MYHIRKATKKDSVEIKTLFQETILQINIKDYTPEQTECWAKRGDNIEVWEERITQQYFIVAESAFQIMGFAALKPDGYLDYLFVHKNFQREGIASLLISDIERYAKQTGIKEICADVSITARPFFENKGYETLIRQTVSIGIEMDNFKMKKILASN